MQERFNATEAKIAANVFKYFLEHQEEKENKLNGSNKNLVVLTALAYFKECSNTKLKKLLPGVQTQPVLDLLQEIGYVKVRAGETARMKFYEVTGDLHRLSANENFSNDTLYVFANCLMNLDIYIDKCDIKSWNLIALMIESSLKVIYASQYIDLNRNQILSIPGNPSNRMVCRKTLEVMGVIKPKVPGGRKTNGGLFTLNKHAFVIERK